MQYRITFETENSQNVSKTPEGQMPNDMKSTLLEVKLNHGDLYDTIGQIEFSPDYVDAVVTARSRKYKFRANVLWMLLGNGTEWTNIKKFALSVS
ncbi:MAG: hypothetical protein Q4D29_10970 [Lachnospiraceae bacterium]|nr:hypothetical protein [Lachnospiraceae bacterium]